MKTICRTQVGNGKENIRMFILDNHNPHELVEYGRAPTPRQGYEHCGGGSRNFFPSIIDQCQI